MNYYGQIDLMKMVNAQRIELKNGKKAVVIPIDDNPSIFNGEKGVFVNVSVNEAKENPYGQSHVIKASLSKVQRESLSKEDLYKLSPIIGNLKESVPSSQKSVGEVSKPAAPAISAEDLPDFLKD